MKKYLDLAQKILDEEEERDDRTGVGTYGLFGETMKFDLREGFPIITTKKMFWKGIVEELLFFIGGDTDTNVLVEKGISIWKGNTSREFLDSVGLVNTPEGDYGPNYGWNLRNFGGHYATSRVLRSNGVVKGEPVEEEIKRCVVKSQNGVDQLKKTIEDIKKNPYSRRHIMTLFDPSTVHKCCLQQCHGYVIHFYVSNDGHLDLCTYQRSCDYFLGVPFNISSYALFLSMVAQVCNLKPRHLIYNFGDIHIYKNHVEQVKEQISREPKKLPTLELNEKIKDIDLFQYDDCKLVNYEYHPAIKAEMAV